MDENMQGNPGVSGMGEQSSVASGAPVSQVQATGNSDANKVLSIAGYIIPILCLITFLTDAKNNEFAKFHANQQLNLFLAGVIVNVVGTVIPFIGWFIILPLGLLTLIVLAIVGVIHAYHGEMKPLPLIGGFSIIK